MDKKKKIVAIVIAAVLAISMSISLFFTGYSCGMSAAISELETAGFYAGGSENETTSINTAESDSSEELETTTDSNSDDGNSGTANNSSGGSNNITNNSNNENSTTANNSNNENNTTANNSNSGNTTTANSNNSTSNKSGTPFEVHGRLSVSGTKLVDQYGSPYQLKGASTHGLAWFPQYVSYDTFKYLRDSFGANVVRLAMYTAEYNGYCQGGNKEELKGIVRKGVDEATKLGMYVIIDWHVLSDGNPLTYKQDAIDFFREMSSTYKNQENVIYEICNEPCNGTQWSDIKQYANEVIPVIRANDKDAIVIVGTPNWSQDVDTASYDKITGHDNIMYALHFYAATHKQWIRDKAITAMNNGLPLFVSEFSICDASGNGGLDINEANIWLDFLNKNNISFVGWNLANKAESSSMFQSWCNKTSGFDDSELSEWAKWLRNAIKK